MSQEILRVCNEKPQTNPGLWKHWSHQAKKSEKLGEVHKRYAYGSKHYYVGQKDEEKELHW